MATKAPVKKSIKYLWRFLLISIIVFNVTIFLLDRGIIGDLPKMSELQNPKSAIASEIYDNNDSLIGKLFIENREPVTYNEIAPSVIDALVATEDERFYDHSGIDAIALGRAISGVVTFNRKGGGSTITQQLAKNLFPRESNSIFKMPYIKLKEMILAVKIERNLTKNEIITLYLNTVPFGHNAYGIKSASRTYFDKDPIDLKTEEAAVLIGMLKANTAYNPVLSPAKSKERRNVVLFQMKINNKISETEYLNLISKDLVTNFKPASSLKHEGMAPYFRQVVELQIRDWCKKKGLNIYKDGLKIYTTLDPVMQQYAEESVDKCMWGRTRYANNYLWNKHPSVLERLIKDSDRYKNYKKDGLTHSQIMELFKTKTSMTLFAWNTNREKDTTITPIDSIKYMRAQIQTGFMAMDPQTGEVKAWVGGINHKYFQYDHVNINTKRQVGSTMKPLLYCFAVDNGYSPCMTVSCSPVLFPGHRWYDAGGSKLGSMQMQKALAYSVNNGTLFVLKQVGIRPFIDFVAKTGIKTKLQEYPSIALGAQEISLIEMIRAYTMFPNYGINVEPIMVTRIEDRNGNILETFIPERKEVIGEITAFKMIKMMQGTVNFGTAKRLKGAYNLSGELCGKTGTTNDEADAWYIGYSPQLLAGCWVGCEDRFLGVGLGEGARAAMPIWGTFWNKIQNDDKLGYNKIKEFEEPISMKGMDICDSYDQISIQRSESVDNVSRGMDDISETEINALDKPIKGMNDKSGADADSWR